MVWLVGTGLMGIEYAKVLNALGVQYVAIGRGNQSASRFEQVVCHDVIRGGIDEFLSNCPKLPSAVIVAVGIESLSETCVKVIKYGVKNILLEKPGIGWMEEIDHLVEVANENAAKVLLAYNRRFYASVLEAEKIIDADGGISSFSFEFTEWSHMIAPLNKSEVEFQNWFMGNSSHVVDTAFFLGGYPSSMTSFYTGANKLDWHTTSSIFAGAGISQSGALFNYQANWNAPGRWAIELLTEKHRLYLKPMEALQIQNIGSVAVNPVEIDDYLDREFKPGFYREAKAFIECDFSRFCTIQEQKNHIDNYYRKMCGY